MDVGHTDAETTEQPESIMFTARVGGKDITRIPWAESFEQQLFETAGVEGVNNLLNGHVH